jgi:hypothetical protein
VPDESYWAHSGPIAPMPQFMPISARTGPFNLRKVFEKNHWTDYLPVVPPTEERVAAMLTAAAIRPTRWWAVCVPPRFASSGSIRSKRWR